MKTLAARQILFVGLILTWLCPVQAGPTRPWPQEDLKRKADLIVIGTVRSTHDIGGHTGKPGLSVPVETRFDIESVLKGPTGVKSVIVRHERLSERFANGYIINKDGSRTILIDPLTFIVFHPRKRVRYLMYLTRRADGAYVPVTGQYDPNYSFFQLLPFFAGSEGQ